MNEIKIRPLKRKDRKVLAELIRKLADKTGSNELLKIMVSDSLSTKAEKGEEKKDRDFIRLGIEIVKLMLEVIEDDVSKWFADLVGKTPEEYDDLPFDVEMQIMEQLVDAEEVNRFFSSALRLSSKIKKLVPGSKMEKTA